jgi:hypothetical protein
VLSGEQGGGISCVKYKLIGHLIMQFCTDVSLFVLRKSTADATCNCTSMDVRSVGDWLDITINISRTGFTTNVSILVSIIIVSRLVVGTNVSRFVTLNVSRFVSTTNVSRLVVGTNVSRFVTINVSRLISITNVNRLVDLKGEDLAENNCFTLRCNSIGLTSQSRRPTDRQCQLRVEVKYFVSSFKIQDDLYCLYGGRQAGRH